MTVSKLHHSLSDKSAHAATVVGSWSTLEGAIPKDEIVQLFKGKNKHPKKKQRVTEAESDVEIVD